MYFGGLPIALVAMTFFFEVRVCVCVRVCVGGVPSVNLNECE